MNLVLIGPSGAGKGTQIDRLVTDYGLVHFCPGNLFREHIKRRTALGLIAQKYIGRGKLVPDEVVEGMLEEWLWLTEPSQDVVFDGFPRTAEQAEFLDRVFTEVSRKLQAVIFLNAPDETVTKRLTGRRVCKLCNDQYHDAENPFRVCAYNKCSGEHLFQMEHDKPESVASRLLEFKASIQPVLDYYRNTGRLVTLSAEAPVDEVHCAIIQALGKLEPRS